MRHLVYFTQPGKINCIIQDRAPNDAPAEAVRALDIEALINTTLEVSPDLLLHIISDDTPEECFTGFVNGLPKEDRIAFIYHDQTTGKIQDQLRDEAWFDATVPQACYPAKHGHHSFMSDDSHQDYWALAEYLAFHLLDRGPRIELLEAVWKRFQ